MTEAEWETCREPHPTLEFRRNSGRTKEWAACTNPIVMLESLRDSGMDSEARKLRLFAAACCRRAWHLLDAGGRATVEVSERFADGSANQEELREAIWANLGCQDIDARTAVDHAAVGAWRPAVALLADVCVGSPPAALSRERAAQAALLRDVFGPLPFRKVKIDPAWLAWNNGTVKRLAEAAYAERALPAGTFDPDLLGVLADALEDCGCTAPDLVTHLRGPGPHVRGCWAIDVLTGRK